MLVLVFNSRSGVRKQNRMVSWPLCTRWLHHARWECNLWILARTIERVQQIALSKGRNMPSTLLLCSDNTVREAKNQIVLLTLANLVAQYKFRVCGLLNLRKSHSHDKLDQTLVFQIIIILNLCFNIDWLFFRYPLSTPCVTRSQSVLRLWGVLTRRIGAVDSLQTPADVIQTMVGELNRPALRGWVGLNTEVHAEKLDFVRKWKGHFSDPQEVKLGGGLLEDSTANHAFIFMLRRGCGWLKQQFANQSNHQSESGLCCFI